MRIRWNSSKAKNTPQGQLSGHDYKASVAVLWTSSWRLCSEWLCGGHPQWEEGSEAFRDGKRDILDHNQLWEKVKKWMLLSHVWLCDPMDYIVQGILQARILEWVAFPFPRGSFQARDWTQVSHTAGGFFTSWPTREAQIWEGELKDLSHAYQNALRLWS